MHYACSVRARRLHMDAHNVYIRGCQRSDTSSRVLLHVLSRAADARVLLHKMFRDNDLETMNYPLLRSSPPTVFRFYRFLARVFLT